MGRWGTWLAAGLAGIGLAAGARAADPHSPYYRYQQVQELQDHALPLIATFTRGNQILVLAADKHAGPPGASRKSALASAFERTRPVLVIVEGFPTSAGVNAPQLAAEGRAFGSAGADAFARGESAYAVSLALLHRVSFMGADPPAAEERDTIMSAGYTSEDVMFAFLVRDLEAALHAGELHGYKDRNLAAVFARCASAESRALGRPALSLADFESRYKLQIHSDLARDPFAGRQADPDMPSMVGRVMQVEAIAADRHLYNIIMQALASKERVMVVLSGSRWKALSGPLGTNLGLPGFR
ncbi:MAG TPA: hypothetical protein VMH86_10000 [Rhizomicrobium sp.]|nr:hypothetical protein [Rhizomicrobium sp.]